MPLIKNKYGKGRVRVMRLHRDGDRHEVSQLNVQAMIEGDFARTYDHVVHGESALDVLLGALEVDRECWSRKHWRRESDCNPTFSCRITLAFALVRFVRS